MRIFVAFAASVLLCMQIAVAQTSASAPADEYFGRHSQSVLEIRNRLNDFDARSDAEMMAPGVVSQIDDEQDAILDWQHQYPSDPWLPRSFAALLRQYHRAGAASNQTALAALAVMRSNYADAPETAATVALLFGSGEQAVVADDPPPSHAVVAATNTASAQTDPWAQFDALRYGTPPH
jgi:hypothetical protein